MRACGVAVFTLLVGAAVATVIPADDPAVAWVGRRAVDARQHTVSFDFAMVSMSFTVSGTTSVGLNLTLTRHANATGFEPDYFDVFVGGRRLPTTSRPATALTARPQVLKVATGLDPGAHTPITVLKSTEPEWNKRSILPNFVTVAGVVLDAAGVVHAPRAAAPSFGSPLAHSGTHQQQSALRLEFVGDSITCGYCNLCHAFPDLKDAAQESGTDAWPHRLCATLGATCHVEAWSGFGLIRNCCGGDVVMPTVYKRTLATVDNEDWDFSSFVPDGVVVNLGTNDHLPSSPSGPVVANYTAAYVDMVMATAAAYDHRATFFLACGPMSTAYCDPVQEVLKQVTARGVHAHFLDQRGFLNDTNRCCGHPDVTADTAMAAAGAAFIQSVLRP